MQLLLSLVLLLTTASDANSSALSAPTAPALTPSPQFSVTVDGEAAFVYLATTDGSRVHNGSFVHISLHPGASREVVVTLLEPDPEGPPKRGALRPDPIPIDDHETRDDPAGLPPVKIAGTTASFQVATPMHAVLELDTEYELSSFSSGLMIFAEFVDTNAPDPSVRPAANPLAAAASCLACCLILIPAPPRPRDSTVVSPARADGAWHVYIPVRRIRQ